MNGKFIAIKSICALLLVAGLAVSTSAISRTMNISVDVPRKHGTHIGGSSGSGGVATDKDAEHTQPEHPEQPTQPDIPTDNDMMTSEKDDGHQSTETKPCEKDAVGHETEKPQATPSKDSIADSYMVFESSKQDSDESRTPPNADSDAEVLADDTQSDEDKVQSGETEAQNAETKHSNHMCRWYILFALVLMAMLVFVSVICRKKKR